MGTRLHYMSKKILYWQNNVIFQIFHTLDFILVIYAGFWYPKKYRVLKYSELEKVFFKQNYSGNSTWQRPIIMCQLEKGVIKILFTTVVTTIKRNYDVKIRQTISELDDHKTGTLFHDFCRCCCVFLIHLVAAFFSSKQHVNVDLVFSLNKITII